MRFKFKYLFRKFVSVGSLSTVYTTILKMKARKHELAEEIQALRGQQKTASADPTREKRPSGNSIKNYFSKSQNKSQNNERLNPLDFQPPDDLMVIEEENDAVDVDIDVHMSQDPEPVGADYHEPSKLDNKQVQSTIGEDTKVTLDSEDMLVAEMLPEQEDSGVFSLCSSPPSVQKLLQFPQPTQQDIDQFEFGKALKNALKKYNIAQNVYLQIKNHFRLTKLKILKILQKTENTWTNRLTRGL